MVGPVRRAEAAPGDEVRVRRDRRRGIDLQQREPLDDLEQVVGPRRVEQLRAQRDPPRLLPRQPMHGERLGERRAGLEPARHSTDYYAWPAGEVAGVADAS